MDSDGWSELEIQRILWGLSQGKWAKKKSYRAALRDAAGEFEVPFAPLTKEDETRLSAEREQTYQKHARAYNWHIAGEKSV